MVITHDVPISLVSILEEEPWKRQRSDCEETFDGHQWRVREAYKYLFWSKHIYFILWRWYSFSQTMRSKESTKQKLKLGWHSLIYFQGPSQIKSMRYTIIEKQHYFDSWVFCLVPRPWNSPLMSPSENGFFSCNWDLFQVQNQVYWLKPLPRLRRDWWAGIYEFLTVLGFVYWSEVHSV